MDDDVAGDWWVDLVDKQDGTTSEGGKLREVDTLYGWDMLEAKGMVQTNGRREQDGHMNTGVGGLVLKLSRLLSCLSHFFCWGVFLSLPSYYIR